LKNENRNSTWIAYSIDGRICGKGVFNETLSSLNISEWNAGIYLFQIQQNDKFSNHKIQLIK
jgi:hypothetical protein